MKKEKELQELLRQESEKASMHFTEAVMKRALDLSSTPYQYQPLVNDNVRKAFMMVFAVLVASIVLVCMIMASAHLSFNGWPAVQPITEYVSDNLYYILAFILSFWIVFAVNAAVREKLFSFR